ncbi:3D domain-containing protein [Alicyclobacillus fastidiosus]|uniref:3D domain-containing protein n=1 Tax=Alicyclobacillus fastidiosus TaxID=392011 RepID=A0ABY6ZCF2_9BACL|nr:3D domain-containing protein [Alicyclobacillus fastidiosus]WAH39785.1 3D domain-containing protein [Alicyclobacillus fastidiosus]
MNWKNTLLSLAAVGATTVACTTPVFAATSNNNTYVINGNDTFWTIAHDHHISVSSLISANPGVNPLNLYPGLTIHLPADQSTQSSFTTNDNSSNVSDVKEISCVATAYTGDSSENGWGAVDYFGNPLKLGTIAVDPSVIPLGATVRVTGYSFAGLPSGSMICHASDEGAAIQGHRIDIFIPTSSGVASDFGFQNVKVCILKP